MNKYLPHTAALLLGGLFACAPAGLMAADVSPSMLTIEKFSAERGDANSQYFMGEHYELGDSGVTQDHRTALDWYQKAAAQGYAAALYKLATFHEQGLGGLSPDAAKATELYRQAAEAGSDQAVQRIAGLNKAAREENQRRQRQLEQEQKTKAEDEARREQLRREQTEMRLKVELERKRALELSAAQAPGQKSGNRPAAQAAPSPAYNVPQLISEILNKEWRAEGRAAEFLPAGDTGCLKTSEAEVTCFSQERSRVVAGKQVKYATKAVLREFRETGVFDVNYIYHAIDLTDAATPGEATDRYGLQLKTGWQQPGMDVRCEMSGTRQIRCAGAKVGQVVFDAL